MLVGNVVGSVAQGGVVVEVVEDWPKVVVFAGFDNVVAGCSVVDVVVVALL